MKSFPTIPVVILVTIVALGAYLAADDLLHTPKVVRDNETQMTPLPTETLEGVITKVEPTFGGKRTGIAFRQDGFAYDIFIAYSGELKVKKTSPFA